MTANITNNVTKHSHKMLVTLQGCACVPLQQDSTTAVFPKDTTHCRPKLLTGKQGQLRTNQVPNTGRLDHAFERPAKHVQLGRSFTDQLPLLQRLHMWVCFSES
jgi:hypothetical protein